MNLLAWKPWAHCTTKKQGPVAAAAFSVIASGVQIIVGPLVTVFDYTK